MSSESNQISLVDLAKQLAGSKSQFRNFHGKIYSFITPSPDAFLEFANALKLHADAMPNRHPCSLMVGDLSTVVSHQSSIIPAISDDGKLVLYTRLDAANLPKCLYFALISPFSVSDGSSSYALAYQSINFMRALIALSFGKLCFYSLVAEFDFDMEGKVSLPGPVIRMPMYADFLKIVDPALINEIADRLCLQLSDYRERLQRASNFVSNAMNQSDEAFRFASYWIALEILVGSTDDAIRNTLMKAYGFTNKTLVDQLLLFDHVSKIRHNLMHKGNFQTLKSYQERLLQLYFWDIVLFQINLPPRGLARTLVTSGMVEEEMARSS